MKFLGQLSFLRSGEASGEEAVGNERVLHLFRNRAELKKSHSALRSEVQRLRDRIKQQEGATARVQDTLRSLEQRLGQPDGAHSALVFYQLRDLWAVGRGLLMQFAADLNAQCEERERRSFLAGYNRERATRLKQVQDELQQTQSRALELAEERERQQARLASLQRFWHYFKRRDVERALQQGRAAEAAHAEQLKAAQLAFELVATEAPQQFAGLTVESRRAINIALIAYAQVLCERLDGGELLKQVRDAVQRREPPLDEYGEQAECEALMNEIARARNALRRKSQVSQEVGKRVERLRELAKYANDTDTTPSAESLAVEEGTDVLSHDTWEIYGVLLR